MNKIIVSISVLLITAATSFAQIGKIKIPAIPKTVTSATGLSDKEIADGLKEALTKGAKMAADSLNKVNGYNGDPLVHIPFPEQLDHVQKQLRSMGMSKQVDEFIVVLNRSAEQAAVEAAPIFTKAITNMSFADAKSILTGADTSATAYLRKATSDSLTARFKPHIQKAMDDNFVASKWRPLANAYNKLATTRTKVNPDLIAFTTSKALKGLFVKVAQEEVKIRKDPAARTSDLLKKVFGQK